MSVQFPSGFAIQPLGANHNRDSFDCGSAKVNEWLKTRARQSQGKNLSITRVLAAADGNIAGFYTLANKGLALDELPAEISRTLPRQLVPVVVLAWLGVDLRYSGMGLGRKLLAAALFHSHSAGQTLPFVALVVDCIDENARRFYEIHDFLHLESWPLRLYLPWASLEAIVRGDS